MNGSSKEGLLMVFPVWVLQWSWLALRIFCGISSTVAFYKELPRSDLMNIKTVQFVTFKLLTSTQPHKLPNCGSCKRHNDILIVCWSYIAPSSHFHVNVLNWLINCNQLMSGWLFLPKHKLELMFSSIEPYAPHGCIFPATLFSCSLYTYSCPPLILPANEKIACTCSRDHGRSLLAIQLSCGTQAFISQPPSTLLSYLYHCHSPIEHCFVGC